jgi:FtsP/CotA-like multicopper oxidase with cupredoxin domain
MSTTQGKKSQGTRRKFLKLAGAASAGVGLAACRTPELRPTSTPKPPVTPTTPTPKPSPAPTAASSEQGTHSTSASAGDPDVMHEDVVKKFLANIGKAPDFWGKPLAYKLDGAVKVFDLVAEEIDWETSEGMVSKMLAYNRTVPGPVIRITEGDSVRVNFTNKMSQSHAIHWHGLLVPNNVDGVPFITQPVVKTGQSFTYEFTVNNTGSHMYHSHHNSAEQTTRGLLGAFIVDPKDKSTEPAFDSDYIMVLNDSAGGYTLNGKGFPDTQPIIAKKGERVRIRYMNEGLMIHPMHLHGLEMEVIAKDGWPVPQFWKCDTLNIAPGERWDVIVTAHTEGVWAFHCHILTHAEAPEGMFGMVTVMIVK